MQNQQHTSEYLAQTRTYQLKRYLPQKCIEKYSFMLIRPPRFYYNEEILNPAKKYKNKFQHFVFQIPFKLSLYSPKNIRYVMLYLHGNSSSRYEGYSQLSLLPPNVGLACFDFNGCGNRIQKKFISLGKYESKEVDIAVKFLKQKGFKVAVWGRSMGAVSALLSQQADVVIADSAFSSLSMACKELSKTQVCKPCYCCFQCIFPCFFWAVGRDVEQKSTMNPQQLQIKKHLSSSSPHRHILFLAAANDKMINCEHAQILLDSYPGPNKRLLLFEGTHNSDRPRQVVQEIFSFAESFFLRNLSLAKESLQDSKNADIDSLQCIRNDRMLSMDIQSQFGNRETVKNLRKNEMAHLQSQQ